ncbi:MAG: hypothetical protein JWO12_1640 [Frankiales bacterium]|nr:hypothetical protein [Frankiales bacterium]
MSSPAVLKHLSNVVFLASLVVVVFAIVDSSLALAVLAVLLFVASFVLTSLKRKASRQARAT